MMIIKLLLLLSTFHSADSDRSFVVDWANKQFLKDGEPFRYASGSFHFSRTPNQDWGDRLTKMKAGGLNAVETYFLWNFHAPEEGTFVFEGDRDIDKFLTLANDTGLLVIARGLPFACAEWEFGGFPWFLKRTDDVFLRTSDPKFLSYVDDWLDVLLPKLKPYLYENGGPIISVQYENEYGDYPSCDQDYLQHLVDKIREHLGSSIVLFTVDRAYTRRALNCGSLKSELTTVDFKVTNYPEFYFYVLRNFEPDAPLVNSEFYTGWLNHWGKPFNKVAASDLASSLDKVLALNASVNFYMYTGGTNFDYWSGANHGLTTDQYDITSYDYDAPISEAGDTTWKYFIVKDVLAKYFPTPTIDVPANSTKTSLSGVKMELKGPLVSFLDVITNSNVTQSSKYPKNMEQLGFGYGFVLYKTTLEQDYNLGAKLEFAFNGLGDRASIVVRSPGNNSEVFYLGTVDNNHLAKPSLFTKQDILTGYELMIVVENRGRVNWGPSMQFEHKGIKGNVTLNSQLLENWDMMHLDLEKLSNVSLHFDQRSDTGSALPLVYQAEVELDLADTFLNTTSFSRGVALINNVILGRYWPVVGPQQTLYVPTAVRSSSKFTLTLVEFEAKSDKEMVDFLDYPILESIES